MSALRLTIFPPHPYSRSVGVSPTFFLLPKHHLPNLLIRQGLPQPERLSALNDIAITQMRVMLSANNVKSLKLNPANARKMLS